MTRSREIVLKAFLNNSSRKDRLLSFLSEKEREYLSHLPDITIAESPPLNLLDHVHWSWFVSVLEKINEKDQRYFLRQFPLDAQKSLSKVLGITPASDKTTPLANAFLKQELINSIQKEDHLPISFLPASPLNLLLQIEKKKLTKLIDYLSLYDLSREIRQIVETKILKKIYSFLTEDEKQFLKIAGTQKEPYVAAEIRLDRWDGTKKSFRLTLHKLGLARLAAALSGQDPDLIWYVCHQLDTGRGKALAKLCTKERAPGVAEWLAEQIKDL